MRRILLLVVGSSVLSVAGQQPSALWRKPNITTSRADCLALAGAAIGKAIGNLGTDGQFAGEDYIVAGNLYYQMAEFDVASNGTQYRDTLKQYFTLAAQNNHANFSDALSYGYAAARAYTAYKDPVFLQLAVESWWFGRSYTLSTADTGAGKIATKNFSVASNCQGATMVGGTFDSTTAGDTAINGLATGYFAVLSALLAEATSDPMYLDAAQQSTTFMQTQLLNTGNVVQDGISGNASCHVSSVIEPYNSGLMLESLAILASIDTASLSLLAAIAQAAIVDNLWQGSNGIISNGGHGGGGDIYLVRGLEAVYSRNELNASLHAYIKDYLAVQFNAIVDLSTSGTDDIYGGNWVGPPTTSFSGNSQTVALSGLLAAVALQDNPAASGTSTTASQSASATTTSKAAGAVSASHHSPVGAIVGGVVGGLVVLAAFGGVWFVLRRRRRKDSAYVPQDGLSMSEVDAEAAVDPFRTAPSPSSTMMTPPSIGATTLPPISPQRYSGGKSSRYPGSTSPTTDSTAKEQPPASRPMMVSNPTASTILSSEGGSPSTMPTQELVRLLNQRLQGQEWDADEAPPTYPAGGH
ncbi:hypothetical protein C8R47DRAFT_1221239 [Mycena vitilis]|nr:hypothetical protein C8R47DRAFT_1221239 [Mycena vitilis]